MKKSYEFRVESAYCQVRLYEGVGIVVGVHAKTRHQGHASGLLTAVVEWADENAIDLKLHARAYGHPVQTILSNSELEKFYSKFGFVRMDQPVDVGCWMFRIKNTPYGERMD